MKPSFSSLKSIVEITMKSKTEQIQDHESSPSEFSIAIMRIAVAQICQSVGFKASQRWAVDTLTDVAARYLQALAKSAASFANCSGRTQSNLFDVVRALEDLYSVQGFGGASTVNRRLLASSTLTDIIKFVKYTDEIPFAKPVRCRYSSKQSALSQKSINCKRQDGVNSLIPRWLPALPDMSEFEIGGKGNWRDEKGGFGSCGNVDGCSVGEKMKVERDKKKKKKTMELPVKRPRVRFKIGVGVGVDGSVVRGKEGFGVDFRNGVCRGGKRVLCGNRSDQDDEKSSLPHKRPR